jgi:D-glycero-alpha-D-manno-heptose-7-phosphate kinase
MGNQKMRPITSVDWKHLSQNITSSKTPLRISFVGGGTDVYGYWSKYGGEVVSASIDKYVYVFVKKHGEVFKENIRVNYSEIELKDNATYVDNFIVRGCLQYLGFEGKVFIGTVSDLPAESGLGSSSSFSVGLLNAIYASTGLHLGAGRLALESNAVEINLLKRPMGKQDAYPAAYGGLNRISFNTDGSVSVTAVNMNTEDFELLDRSLCLVFSGQTRKSSDVLSGQVASTKSNDNHQELSLLKEQVQQFVDLLENRFSLDGLGELLSSAWEKKKKVAKGVSSSTLNEVYEKAINSGSYGAKLCGAGGGGFFLCVVDSRKMPEFITKMSPYKVIPIRLSSAGSQIL